MIKYALIFVFMIMVSFTSYLMYHLGVWKDVNLSTVQQEQLQTVYFEHTGPYHKLSKQRATIENHMASQGKPCVRTFGQYFDDPYLVEEARLRSHIGCLVDGEVPQLIENLVVGKIPSGQYVQAVFTGSPAIGPLKVYPKVEDYMKEHGLKQNGALIEIYEIHSIQKNNAMTTTYLFPAISADQATSTETTTSSEETTTN